MAVKEDLPFSWNLVPGPAAQHSSKEAHVHSASGHSAGHPQTYTKEGKDWGEFLSSATFPPFFLNVIIYLKITPIPSLVLWAILGPFRIICENCNREYFNSQQKFYRWVITTKSSVFTIITKSVCLNGISQEKGYNARIWLNLKKNEFEEVFKKLKVYINIYSTFFLNFNIQNKLTFHRTGCQDLVPRVPTNSLSWERRDKPRL